MSAFKLTSSNVEKRRLQSDRDDNEAQWSSQARIDDAEGKIDLIKYANIHNFLFIFSNFEIGTLYAEG